MQYSIAKTAWKNLGVWNTVFWGIFSSLALVLNLKLSCVMIQETKLKDNLRKKIDDINTVILGRLFFSLFSLQNETVEQTQDFQV